MADVPTRAGVAGTYLQTQTAAYSYGASQGQGSAWFGPSAPMAPSAPPDVAGRQFDYPVGYNLNTRPRVYEPIGFRDLRALADGYDLLRLAIETRKDQLSRMSWSIKSRDSEAKDKNDPRVKALTAFFQRPDGEHGWQDWLRPILEDLFVIDAPALYLRRDRGGRLVELVQLDGATIKPIIDDWGRTPRPYSIGGVDTYPPAYQQILKGLPAVDYSTRDLLYRPRNRRIHTPYGFSAVEQIVTTVNIALRRQLSTLSYFTEGNIPDAIAQLPKEWSPDQIVSFQQHWDAYFSGDLGRRRRVKFVPGAGANFIHETRPADLKGDFDEWLAKLVCFAFSISPQALTKQMNRASADTQKQLSEEEGLEPILLWIKALIDDVIAYEFGASDLAFTWDNDDEADETAQLAVLSGYVSKAIMTVNEARDRLGLDPLPDPEASQGMIITASGAVPLGSFAQQQEQTAANAKLMADAQARQPVVPPGASDLPGQEGHGGSGGRQQPPGHGEVTKANANHDDEGRFASGSGSAGGSKPTNEDWETAKSIAKSVAIGAALTATATVAVFLAPELFALAGGVAAGEAAAAAGATAAEAVSAATSSGRFVKVTQAIQGFAQGAYIDAGLKAGKLALTHLGFDTKAVEAELKPYQDLLKAAVSTNPRIGEIMAHTSDVMRDHLVEDLRKRYQDPHDAELIDAAAGAISDACEAYKARLAAVGKVYTLGKRRLGTAWRSPEPIPFDRPATAKAEAAIGGRLRKALDTLGAEVAKALRTHAKNASVQFVKASPDDPDPDEDDRVRRRADDIVNEFDLGSLYAEAEPIGADLEEVVNDTVARAVAQVGPDDSAGLVNQVNARAVAIARERAAELVGMHLDADGKLVPSDDAEMAITDTTRDMLRATIADDLAAGKTTDEIADDIAEHYAFSPERAAVIAATEVSRANSMAAQESYQAAADAGVPVKKRWLAEVDCCDVCSANQAAGAIDLDDTFPSGDDTPPGHPNCRCSLSPVVGDADGQLRRRDEKGSEASILVQGPGQPQPR